MTAADDLVYLPDAPAIPGLVFRPFRDPSDYAVMAALSEHAFRTDAIDVVMTAEEFAAAYAPSSSCDPARDLLFAEVNERPVAVAYIAKGWLTGAARIYPLNGRVHPDWRRLGLGRALLRRNERIQRQLAAADPPDAPRFFLSYAFDSAAGAVALLRSEGYTSVRAGYMMSRPLEGNLPDVPLPPGIAVRPVEPEHYQAIWEAQIEAFRDSWGFGEGTEETYQKFFLGDPHFDPTLWRVAWEGDQVVGMVRSFINRGENETLRRLRGYTETICVRAPWRGRGIARALLWQSLRAVHDRGMTEAALSVDTKNETGALNLYESCGFTVKTCRREYRKPM